VKPQGVTCRCAQPVSGLRHKLGVCGADGQVTLLVERQTAQARAVTEVEQVVGSLEARVRRLRATDAQAGLMPARLTELEQWAESTARRLRCALEREREIER
jgi:hypothetical protein